MKAFIESSSRDRVVHCAVCATHRRPEYVPWQQHAVECAVRASQIACRPPAPRPRVNLVAGALHL
jgi:hypothetical protein